MTRSLAGTGNGPAPPRVRGGIQVPSFEAEMVLHSHLGGGTRTKVRSKERLHPCSANVQAPMRDGVYTQVVNRTEQNMTVTLAHVNGLRRRRHEEGRGFVGARRGSVCLAYRVWL